MSYFLFLLVNATLFLRPAELIPELLGWNIYLYLILACLAFSLPEVAKFFTTRSLDTQPVALCVFGILPAVMLAPLASMDLEESLRTGIYFLKVIVYFLLLVSLINTPARLRSFLRWLLVFCLALTSVTILQYHAIIDLPTLKPLVDSQIDRGTGELIYFNRLQGSGIFQDPNDLCLMLAAALPLCLFFIKDEKHLVGRILWLGQVGLFVYAIALTRSRGGLLAVLAGVGTWMSLNYGWRRTVVMAFLGLPLLFLLGDRQTTISAAEGTGQSRIQEWSDWMLEFREHPLVGKGMPLAKEEDDATERLPGQELKHLAHNSYLQGYADMGIFGGTLFLGAFFIALWSLLRFARHSKNMVHFQMKTLLPYVIASVSAYAVGLLTLSLCYVVPTYLILGLAAIYSRMAVCQPPIPTLRLNLKVVGRCAAAGFAYLAVMYVFVRVFINWA